MSKASPKDLSSEVVQSAVQELYGIKSIKPPTSIGEGIENAAWIFYTQKQDYILKIFSNSETIEGDVNEEVLLYNYLLQHQINAPEVIPTLEGVNVPVICSDTYPAILMKYEKLKRVPASDLSQKQVHKIASSIAHMHKVLMNYPRTERIKPTTHDAMSIYNHSLKDFDMFLTSPNAKSPHLQDHARLRKIRTDAINYLQKQKLEKELTKSIIHNDLALGHVLFLQNGDIYIFDFSDFECGAVALDLGVLFFNFYREGQLTIEQWKSMLEEFLSVYTQTVKLTDNDKKAIQIFTVSRMLEHIRYLDRMSIREGYPVDEKGVKKRYDLLEHLYLSAFSSK